MLSIITPVYNGEKYIESCIMNVIEQNCPSVEHIIVDGLSDDKTMEIVNHYAGIYNHISCFSEKDLGQSHAMNKGILCSSYDIIGFLNVDDYYEPNVLNHIIQIFKNIEAPGMVVGNCNIWNYDNSLKEINKPKNLHIDDLLSGPGKNPFPANPSSYFYHKSLHDIVGLYDENDHYAMDLDFILRAAREIKILYVDELWGNFRLINDTKTYNSIKSGQLNERVKQTILKYKTFDSKSERYSYLVKYYFHNSIKIWIKYNISRLFYFSLHPICFIKYLSARYHK